MSNQKKGRINAEDEIAQPHPGEKLKRARENQGLSVADVAVRLKLSTYKINALERGDIEGLAAPVFVAGYIRTYARLLDLSETEVLADFEALLPATEPETDTGLATNDESYKALSRDNSSQFSLRDKSAGNPLGIVALLGVLVVVAVYVLWPSSPAVRSNTAKVDDVAVGKKHEVPASETDLASGGESVGDADALVKSEVSPPVDEAEDQSVVADKKLEQVAVKEAVPSKEVVATFPPIAEGMKSELLLRFKSDSWAEVRDARGQRLVYRLGKAGSQRVVKGVAPFFVQLGFVQGVDITYNGELYDLSQYANRRSVRLSIGKDGDHVSDE